MSYNSDEVAIRVSHVIKAYKIFKIGRASCRERV